MSYRVKDKKKNSCKEDKEKKSHCMHLQKKKKSSAQAIAEKIPPEAGKLIKLHKTLPFQCYIMYIDLQFYM